MEPENLHSNKRSGDGDAAGPHFEQQYSRLITTELIFIYQIFERCLLSSGHSAT